MKKLFFMAAVAGVAFVSCTKNELAPSAAEQNEITFTTPVVAPATKAIVDGVVYPTTESFGVYAWHNTATEAYMNEVEVKYNSNLTDDFTSESEENGGWMPSEVYYWPKSGGLTFDAFSPWSVNDKVSATKADGITITDYIVADAADVDLMYATRTAEKTDVNDKFNVGIPYDGVDIAFNHALTAVQIKAKTYSEYEAEIKITSIKIVNADSNGTFNQDVTGGNPEWDTTSEPKEYTFEKVTVTQTAVNCGTKLLLPQNFDDDLAITIEYTINGHAQNGTFKFADHKDGKKGETTVTVEKWEMGNRYIYTLVFALNEIFFEPIVTDWEDITMGDIIIPTPAN